jgi:hypothetical protein
MAATTPSGSSRLEPGRDYGALVIFLVARRNIGPAWERRNLAAISRDHIRTRLEMRGWQ